MSIVAYFLSKRESDVVPLRGASPGHGIAEHVKRLSISGNLIHSLGNVFRPYVFQSACSLMARSTQSRTKGLKDSCRHACPQVCRKDNPAAGRPSER